MLAIAGFCFVQNSSRLCENSVPVQPPPEFRGLWRRGRQKIAKNYALRGDTETRVEFLHGLQDFRTNTTPLIKNGFSVAKVWCRINP
jgi:hypothetical protein